MPMTALYSYFPELAIDEVRYATVLKDDLIPPGNYLFMEYYCDEQGCDCRRVFIQMYNPECPAGFFGIINFGWEPKAFYTAWTKAGIPADELKGPSLARGPQHECASAFLDIFKEAVKDEEYVDRLRRHYALFKREVERRKQAPAARPLAGAAASANKPCPCGSGKKYKKCCGSASCAQGRPW